MMTIENKAFAADMPAAPRATGWLTRIERVAIALPDPVMLFVGMINPLKRPPLRARWGLRGAV